MTVQIIGAEKKAGTAHIFSGTIEIGIIIYATKQHRDLPHEIPPKNVYIGYIEIYPQHRGRGLGVAAVDKFISIRKKVGDNFMVISPSPGLDSWWESLGFEPVISYYYPPTSLGSNRALFMGRRI